MVWIVWVGVVFHKNVYGLLLPLATALRTAVLVFGQVMALAIEILASKMVTVLVVIMVPVEEVEFNVTLYDPAPENICDGLTDVETFKLPDEGSPKFHADVEVHEERLLKFTELEGWQVKVKSELFIGVSKIFTSSIAKPSKLLQALSEAKTKRKLTFICPAKPERS